MIQPASTLAAMIGPADGELTIVRVSDEEPNPDALTADQIDTFGNVARRTIVVQLTTDDGMAMSITLDMAGAAAIGGDMLDLAEQLGATR